ncbi:MAG: hypothetical protein MUD14_16640 [Hydrococcus sp. Prado102]|jgi:hypothetical protein|nr:hypothetical protein [Hydrococcus sp. Prado102]
MNRKRIIFSGIVTALLGGGIGWIVGRALVPSPYYRNLEVKYAAIGATAGSLLGCAQESVRQLKQQRDRDRESNKNL